MGAITVRGGPRLLAATQEGLRVVFLAGEAKRREGGLLVAAIAEGLLLAQSALAPRVLLVCLERDAEWLLGCNTPYRIRELVDSIITGYFVTTIKGVVARLMCFAPIVGLLGLECSAKLNDTCIFRLSDCRMTEVSVAQRWRKFQECLRANSSS